MKKIIAAVLVGFTPCARSCGGGHAPGIVKTGLNQVGSGSVDIRPRHRRRKSDYSRRNRPGQIVETAGRMVRTTRASADDVTEI